MSSVKSEQGGANEGVGGDGAWRWDAERRRVGAYGAESAGPALGARQPADGRRGYAAAAAVRCVRSTVNEGLVSQIHSQRRDIC